MNTINLKTLFEKFRNITDPRVRILDELYGSNLSIQQKAPLDSKGKPLPWFTYPAIEYLSRLDLTGADLFEFGSGFGTIYWSRRCKSITSVENNPEWFENITSKAKKHKNIKLFLAQSRDEYINAILKTKRKFDVIIVDGVYRDGSSLSALKCLKDGGMIILDNSDWYANAAKILRDTGYTQIDFDGFGPGNTYTWVTSIFFKSIKFIHTENVSKNYSKGGFKHVVQSK